MDKYLNSEPVARVRGNMIRISIAYFYGIGAAVRPLRNLKPQKLDFDTWSNLFAAEQALTGLFGAQWFWPAIRASYAPGQKLLEAIGQTTGKMIDSDIEVGEAYGITASLHEFETVLNAELSMCDSYFVSRKAAYDTSSLISNAEVMFSTDLGTKVPEAIPDVREAGKCLAFELSTAAGLHIMRALDAIIRRYWDAVSGGKPHPRQRNLGVYLKQLSEKKLGSAKAIATLQQIKDLHRNPLVHPEDRLTLDDAVGLFGIAQSAANYMLKEIPSPPAVTPSSSVSPP